MAQPPPTPSHCISKHKEDDHNQQIGCSFVLLISSILSSAVEKLCQLFRDTRKPAVQGKRIQSTSQQEEEHDNSVNKAPTQDLYM